MQWKSAEAREFAARTGVTDPELAVRIRAREILAEAGVGGIPVQFPALFRVMGVRKVRAAGMVLEGALRSSGPSTFDILVREDRHPRRQRFTIAHELGHLLFYRFAEQAKSSQHTDARQAPIEEERLCNVAAEEFLMPEWFVQKAFSTEGDPLSCIRAIARECDVSIEAALIRCAPFVTRGGALQFWCKRQGWKLKLARRTGKTKTRLDTFDDCDGGGRFIEEAARVARWERHGWLRSHRPPATAHVSTRTVTLPSARGCATVLVEHVLSKPGTDLHPGRLEQFARNLVREARRTRPDPQCTKCGGEGWVGRPDGFARCRCRLQVLARRRKEDLAALSAV